MSQLRIQLRNDTLRLGHGFGLRFQRTLRIPDDGGTWPLPPGLGDFPVRKVDDYADRVPAAWREHGGVFLPMYQREAMWLQFEGQAWRPRALKVAVGRQCALTGEPWSEGLHAAPQDYLVTPPQPWLDGIAVGPGLIRQFVAMPLGLGYTVEHQLSGEETHGGLQLKLWEPRPGIFPEVEPPLVRAARRGPMLECAAPRCAMAIDDAVGVQEMGLAAGGRMQQKVYEDPHGIDVWDDERTARVYVHLVNSAQWREITGERCPESPVTARSYAKAGLPWFALYDEQQPALGGSDRLAGLRSVRELDEASVTRPQQDDASLGPQPIRTLWTRISKPFGVRDGHW